MAEDRTSDPADQPEDDKTPPQRNHTRALSAGRFRRSGRARQLVRQAAKESRATHLRRSSRRWRVGT